jgi:Lrp/AsnC family transcriptional regulator, leucine-responsive regulatory protein
VAIDADQTDLEILALLQDDGRRSVADIAGRVTLSATAVKRRIDKLEAQGVISGYSARVNYAKLGWSVAAFVMLRFGGKTSPEQMDQEASRIPEVSAVYTTTGDQDVIALVRTKDIDHLRDVIHRLRVSRSTMSTRTHVILASHVKEDWRPALDAGGGKDTT